MEKELEQVCSALARAGQTLEVLSRPNQYCPFHHQGELRSWSLPECRTCSYSYGHRATSGSSLSIPYKAEFRAMCWVEFFLQEAWRDE